MTEEMQRPIVRPNHGPLTEKEQAELSALLSKICHLRQQAIEQAIACLPANMRERARLDWYRRWESF